MAADRRVLVACGGRSLEREISLASGRRAAHALRALGYETELVDADPKFVERVVRDRPWFVFVAMHGRGGEDGTVQDLLNIFGVPYTGSDALASNLCLDKHAFKTMCVYGGIPTPDWHTFTQLAFTEYGGAAPVLERVVDELGLPLVVKPARQGSSLGIRIVEQREHFAEAVVSAMSYDDRVLIERFVAGRELTVTVLGDPSSPEPLPVMEIRTDEPYYTFAAHYEIGAAVVEQADLPAESAELVTQTAVNAYVAAGCRDFARVDIKLGDDGPQVLEINTIPGLTETGPTPLAAEAAGISFEQLIERICRRTVGA